MAAHDELIRKLPDSYRMIKDKIHERIVGMDEVVDLLLAGIFSGGHCLLEGVPGLAKTLLIRTLADLLDLRFSRIQFTPDLMPSDIVGAEVIVEDAETGERRFRFMSGPVFCHILLADEINRTPPKTQAALIEAMEEHQVTMGGQRHALEGPFFVLATQNPIEQEGTYPLPAGQLDRFTFMIRVDYPSHEEEYRIIRMTTVPGEVRTSPVLGRDDIQEILRIVRDQHVPEDVVRYATTVARLTRPKAPESPDTVKRYLSWGVGPRGTHGLVMAAKVRAMLSGRPAPDADDIRYLAPHAFRHRMIPNFQAEAEGVTKDDILATVLEQAAGPGRGTRTATRAG